MNSTNIDTKLKKLEEIADWFENQEEVDVEVGLEKVKEAVTLIKEARTRIREVENEFEEIKKEIDPGTEEKIVVEEESVSIEIKPDDSNDMPF